MSDMRTRIQTALSEVEKQQIVASRAGYTPASRRKIEKAKAAAFDALMAAGLRPLFAIDIPGELMPLAYHAYDFGMVNDEDTDPATALVWLQAIRLLMTFLGAEVDDLQNLTSLRDELKELADDNEHS
ncbi:hypothetical protein Rctr85_055 [Virus Rctr85]|nr:hypothetical protein Rctr85_055 [Virus Rctr85]